MRSTRRTVATALAVSLSLLGAGCGGGGDEPADQQYVLTDLDGGKVAVDPTAPAVPTSTETSSEPSSSEPSSSGPSSSATEDGPSSNAATDAPTGRDLVDRIVTAIGDDDAVHVSGGDDSATPVLEADHHFGTAGTDFDATIALDAAAPVEFRRVGQALYVDDGSGFTVLAAGDDAAAGRLAAFVPALRAWSPLTDLREVLEGAGTVTEGGPTDVDGVAVTSYTFSLEVSALSRPSTVLPGTTPDTATATLSLDADDLPVRLDLDLGTSISRVGYSDWGTAVPIEAP